MSDEFTPNLNLTKPDVGASDDTWGEKLNTNFDILDAAVAAAASIPPEYVTEAELTVILDGYISDAELTTILGDYVTDAELTAALVGYVTQAEFPEKVDDRVAALLTAGSNITLTYDDAGNKLTIASTGGGGGGATVTVSDTPPASPTANSLWWESDTGLLYIYYNDGDSSQWVSVVGASDPATYAVRYDMGQTLDTTQRTQARSNIYAAPFDALAYNGLQVNGAFDVSQEFGSSGVVATGGVSKYFMDGWIYYSTAATAAVNAAQYPGGPSGLQRFAGIITTVAQPSITGNDFVTISQNIEGYRVNRLGWGTGSAQPITIGFWTSHSRVGTYTVTVRNVAATRSYSTSYVQAVANTFQYNVITIPGCTDGVWPSDHTVGLNLYFGLAGGTTFVAPSLNNWLNGNYVVGTGQVNAVQAVNDTFRLAGVIVLPGIEIPSAARVPLIMRPYDQEIITCKRYFYNGVPAMTGIVYSTTIISQLKAPHPVQMRANPTVTMTAPFTVNAGGGGWAGPFTVTGFSGNTSNTIFLCTDTNVASGLTPGAVVMTNSGGGNINIDARL